jgi:hypothetical protein
MPIRQHLEENASFEPEAIAAMSRAFEDACSALNIPAGDRTGRETIATRVIDLARTGVIDAAALKARVVQESGQIA